MELLTKLTLKVYCRLILIGYRELSWTERLESLWKSIIAFSPIVVIFGALSNWVLDNQLFCYAVIILIVINMIFGGVMHWKKKKFSIKTFFNKTSEMVICVSLFYLGLELIISIGGDNDFTHVFRTVLQMSSLLYPFSKIAKNIHILSKGKYPPEWAMRKIYDFEKTGDLQEFLNPKNNSPS